ncbi:P-loop ATPase, Sll1717 family [Blastococcus sp. SYSU D00922]
MATRKSKLKSTFTLGGEQAEADSLLEDAFYETSDYQVIVSRSDTRCFLIGRTGSGKSAALTHLQDTQSDHVIRINPEDLALPYITNLQAIRYLDSLEVNLDNFWTTLWRHVLLVEILRHRYRVDSPEAKQNFWGILRDRVKADRTKRAALDYLEEYEGRFWCEADERIREITDNFTRRIDAAAGAKAGLGQMSFNMEGGYGLEESRQSKAEQVDRFQRVVNDTQLARLNQMMSVLDEDVLDSPQHFTYVVIDDLDKDWVDERIANDLIRCLFSTVLSLKRVKNLKVLVALRTNIFQELDFGKRGGGQEEKLRSLVLPIRWTRLDLEELLNERVSVAGRALGMDVVEIGDLLPMPNRARGNALEYMLERTLLRPRDAIAFGNECLSVGVGRARLTWQDIFAAEKAYSAKRVLALRDEWKTTYPGIERVIDRFRGSPAKMTREELTERLDDIMLLLSDSDFAGTRWLTTATQSMWSAAYDASWGEMYQPLLLVLYQIGLLGCSTRTSGQPFFFSDDPLFMEHRSNVETCGAFYVHRIYQAGLDIHPVSAHR